MARSLVQDLTIYGLSDSLARGLNIVLLPLYARFLTPQSLGQLDVLLTTILLGGYLTQSGLDSAEARYYFQSEDPEDHKLTLTTSLVYQLVCGLVLLLAAVLLRRWMARTFLGAESLSFLVVVAAVSFPLTPAFRLVRSHLRRLRQARRYAVFQTVFVGTNLLGISFLVGVFKLGVLGAILGSLLALGVSTVISYPTFRSWFVRRFSWKRLKDLLAYGLPLLPAGFAVWTISLVNRYFISYFRTLEEVGLFSVANMIATGASLVTGPVSLGWLPFVQSVRKRAEAQNLYVRFFSASLVGFALVWVLLSVLAPEILRLLATSTYEAVAPVVPVLTLGIILNAYYFIGGTGQAVVFRQQYIGLATVMGAAISIAMNFLLIPPYGIMGAAIATLVSQLVAIGLIFIISHKMHPIPYSWGHCFLVVVTSTGCIVVGQRMDLGGMVPTILAKLAFVAALLVIWQRLRIISVAETIHLLKDSFRQRKGAEGG